MKPLRIIITGGSGFLGSWFSRVAKANGHQVAVISRSTRPLPGFYDVTWITGSLDEPPWDEIERFSPDSCVHAAWIASPGVYTTSPENLQWVRWSADFIAGLPKRAIRHILVLGTCIEYQITGRPLKEDLTPLAPTSIYAHCKHELHGQLQPQLSSLGVPLAWARIFYPYGENEHPQRLVSSIITKFLADESVTLKTPHSLKDYIHAEDVAAALLMLVEQRYDGVVNIGTGEAVTVEIIARKLAELLGRSELVRLSPTAANDPLDFVVADASRLRSLGWRQQVMLEAGLRRMVEARCQ